MTILNKPIGTLALALTLLTCAPSMGVGQVTAPSATAPAASAIDRQREAQAIRAHVTFLASDAMQGRDTGSNEYEIAADYVASRFEQAGLRPGGEGKSWFQPFQLVEARLAGPGEAVLTIAGARRPLAYGKDWTPWANAASTRTKVDARWCSSARGSSSRG